VSGGNEEKGRGKGNEEGREGRERREKGEKG
jgi:hypothetical protein